MVGFLARCKWVSRCLAVTLTGDSNLESSTKSCLEESSGRSASSIQPRCENRGSSPYDPAATVRLSRGSLQSASRPWTRPGRYCSASLAFRMGVFRDDEHARGRLNTNLKRQSASWCSGASGYNARATTLLETHHATRIRPASGGKC